MAKRRIASVAAEELVTRGLINDRDVRYEDPRWVYFDYGGNVKGLDNKPVAFEALAVVLEDESITELQHWTIGNDQYYEPSDDGKTLYIVGDADGAASKNSNWGHFIQSLDACGMPKEMQSGLAEDASTFAGIRIHCVRKSIDRSRDGDNKKSEVPIAAKILAYPGEKASKSSKKSGGKASSKSKKAEDSGDDDDVDVKALAAKYIVAAVKGAEEDIDFSDLAGEVMSAMIAAQHPKGERPAIRDYVAEMSEDDVKEIDGITVVKGTVAEE